MANTHSQDHPYHHGDLPRAIIKAALEILRETQSLDFSLRELARRAGVSHNAPYKHFADKRELLAAVSAAGFEALTKRMALEIGAISNARAQLFALLRAYINHGVENPALYRLMFGGFLSGPDQGRPDIERGEAEKTKDLLAAVIVAGGLGRPIPNTARNEKRIAGAILACWSLVHGLTLLLADGLVGPKKKADALSDILLKGLVEGLAADLPALPPGTWVGPSVETAIS
jgi:AcrR family transcriptional regulator